MPTEAERRISMSKTKTSNYQFYYEGMYWGSREEYAEWVRTQINDSKNLKRGAL
jgi:hypothetical protein